MFFSTVRRLSSLATVLYFVLLASAMAESARSVGPRLSDPEFFALLDLGRADLVEVRQAVEKSDWLAAKHLLAEHMRNRPSPHWDIDPRAIGRDPHASEPEADEALTHRFNSLGIKWQFGTNIEWTFNPTTQPDSKWPRNHEWTWQFNRHVPWLALGNAFYATGDEKYAREFVAELKSWVHDCPVPLDHVRNSPYSPWRTIEAGIRTGTTWPEIFPRFLAAKAFDDEAVVLMLKSFEDHAEYLMKFHTGGNWFTMEANGLYHIGALFPEFKEAALWRETAADRLDHELDNQVYPDGAQMELAPGYHGIAARNFFGPLKLIAMTGFKPPADYAPKMERMFNYGLYAMSPARTLPPLNDSGWASVIPLLSEGAEVFPERQDFRWVVSHGGEGRTPAETSYFFPYAGQSFMRSGWDESACWLCMDGGPFGMGHQHEDKLSVIISAYGKPLLVEGGVYTYDASEWRSYVLSSRAHNVVLVDGFEQNRRHEPKNTYVVKSPLPHVWESNATFDHAAARYDEGFGPNAQRLITQTRHAFFIKPDLFIIMDELNPLDGKPHVCESLFHLDAADVAVDRLRISTKNKGPNLTIASFGNDDVEIVKGQKEPVVQGWLPEYGKYGGIRPIPTAVYRRTIDHKTTVLYALCPSPKAAECPVKNLSLSENVLTIQFEQGPDKVIRFQPFPAQ